MKRFRGIVVVTVLHCLVADVARAQHDHHQSASSPEHIGTVHFATSCSPAVAQRFDRGVTLLHSFEFRASIAAFTDLLAADSTCAMAQWGIALSRWGNPTAAGNRTPAQLQPGRLAADAAQRLSASTTERERLYAAAVSQLYADVEHLDQRTRIAAYEQAMAQLVAAQPSDTEAKIFYAIALVAAASPTDKTYAKQLLAGAILEPIWAVQPNHPGLAHYLIHAYDAPALAGKATLAARRYALIAPSAAHALHMPSHTFTRIGMWKESAATNHRSIAAALRDGSIAEALHAADYMMYADLQMRREADAKALLDTIPLMAKRFDPNAVTGAAPGSAGVFALAAIPARYALERNDWAQAAQLVPHASSFEWTEAMVYFARALGASRLRDAASARSSADSLTAIQSRLAQRGESYWAEQVAIQELGARAWLDLAERRQDPALTKMREAADRENATEKSSVTPGPLAPARELLGDMLLELGLSRDALVEYRAALQKEPNRYRSLDGARRAATTIGDKKAAASYAAQIRKLTGA